jgi:hypothetical protein
MVINAHQSRLTPISRRGLSNISIFALIWIADYLLKATISRSDTVAYNRLHTIELMKFSLPCYKTLQLANQNLYPDDG